MGNIAKGHRSVSVIDVACENPHFLEEPANGNHLLLVVAEFGDKTHLAVAGLAGTADPLVVWIGGTLALSSTALPGILAGRTIPRRIPLRLLHRIGGISFLVLAAPAPARAIM